MWRQIKGISDVRGQIRKSFLPYINRQWVYAFNTPLRFTRPLFPTPGRILGRVCIIMVGHNDSIHGGTSGQTGCVEQQCAHCVLIRWPGNTPWYTLIIFPILLKEVHIDNVHNLKSPILEKVIFLYLLFHYTIIPTGRREMTQKSFT